MSTIVGNVVLDAAVSHPEIPAHEIASALSIVAGGIICFIGLIRCGWIVDLIPLVSICAFMTGSALNIAVGQVPTLLGTSKLFNTRAATYKVFIDCFRHLPDTTLDASVGITALFFLYAVRSACNYAARKYPARAKLIFFSSTLRTVFTILLYTLVSWLVNRNHRSDPRLSILGSVPRGMNRSLKSNMAIY